MNHHPLERKIARLRRRVRMLLVVYGASRVILVAVAAAGIVALGDWLIHFDDRGIRVMATLTVVAAVVWAAIRYLLAGLTRPLRDVDVALRVEQRFPQLNDRLASTIEFLRQREDDPLAGSSALRRAVINQTRAEVDHLDLNDAIRTKPSLRAALAAIGICLLGAAIALLDPTSARVAISRLAYPLAELPWPQVNHLQLRQPVRRVALGRDFEVEVIDAFGAELPDKVWIQYRFKDSAGQPNVEEQPMLFAGDAMLARRESVTRPFSYRVRGGDDDSMPWIGVEVVEPPAVEDLQVELHYPSYTGWPDKTSDPRIRALVGTEVSFRGTTTKPVRRVKVETSDGKQYEAQVDDDGFGFVLPGKEGRPLVVEETGSYWFILEGRDALVGGTDLRYDLRAVRDLRPSVSIDEPVGNVYVTADAVVPLKIVAKDDLRLSRVALNFVRGGREKEEPSPEVVTLYEAPQREMADAALRQVSGEPQGESRTLDHRWDLAPLALQPGSQTTFYATATDEVPSTGESPKRLLYVITVAELEDRLAQRQSLILGELTRVLEIERDVRQRTSGAEIQVDQIGRLAEQDVDRLQGAELGQRQVSRTLTNSTDGIRAQVKAVLAELENNQLDSPELTQRMTSLAGKLDQLTAEDLPVIQRDLTSALKTAQTQNDPTREETANENNDRLHLKHALTEAGQHEDAVIASLGQMLSELSQWNRFRQLRRELADVRLKQQQMIEQTSQLARQTLSKAWEELPPQQQADAKKLAHNQQDLVRRFDALRENLEKMRDRLTSEDPLAAETIDDALHHADQQGIAGQMSRAGEHIGANQMGQAAARQQQVQQDLDEMLDIMANRREQRLDRLVRKLREAESQLAELRQQQDGLRKKMKKAAGIADEKQRQRRLERLTREQRQLEEQARRFARRLERLQADRASRSTARGASKMGKAGQQASADQAAEASQQAEAAQGDLEQAQQELAQRRKQAERDLAIEQLARIEDALKSLKNRQKQVLVDTLRLEQLRHDQGRLSRGQLITLRDTAQVQQSLHGETDSLAKKIEAVAAFHLALSTAAQQMRWSAERLIERQTGSPTQEAQRLAMTRIELLLEALKPDAGKDKSGKSRGGDGGGGQGGQPGGGDGISDVAQLKLIKLLQQDLNLRTQALGQDKGSADDVPGAERQRYTRLSAEQGKLADLVRNLLRPADESPPEDDPDGLPDPLDDLEGKTPLDEETP